MALSAYLIPLKFGSGIRKVYTIIVVDACHVGQHEGAERDRAERRIDQAAHGVTLIAWRCLRRADAIRVEQSDPPTWACP